ncbi:MAG: O-antigen polymerase [Myxococcaceae bacterium]|nr:O-antigen polymerase [Myxococcaceae bacterium]
MAEPVFDHAAPARAATEERAAGLSAALYASAIAASWLMWVVPDAGFDRYHLPKELAALLGALLSVWQLGRSGRSIAWDGITQLALATLAMGLVSACFATTPLLSLRSLSLQLAATVLFLTARACPRSELRLLLGGIVLAAAGVALVALAEGQGLITQLSRRGRTPGSLLGQRNSVAHLMVLASPVAWWLTRHAERPWLRALAGLASSLLAATLLLTRSRAGWLGFAAAFLVFALGSLLQERATLARSWRARTWPLTCALLGIVLLALAPVRLPWSAAHPYRETLARLLDVEHGSGAGRLAQYGASLRLVALHPWLGAGPGNWLVEYPRVSPPGDVAFQGRTWLHTGRLPNSDWVALWTEQGSLAVLLAGALGLAVCRAARGQSWTVLTWSAAAGLAVVSLLDAVLQLPASACLCALLFGLSAPSRVASGGMRRRSWIGALLACALLLASGLAARRALGLWSRTRPGGGSEAMEQAVSWNGADLWARFSLAEAYVLAGRCVEAKPHLDALKTLLPYHRSVERLRCQSAVQPPP